MKTETRDAFTLVEMIVAVAIVSLMMLFMFTLVTQSIDAWEAGGRRMESGQAARIGMNVIAQELQYALVGTRTNAGLAAGSTFNNFAPLFATTGIPGERSSAIQAVPGSGALFFPAPIGPFGGGTNYRPFAEVGYLCYFVTGQGANTMIGPRYYLVRHGDQPGSVRQAALQNFYFRQTPNNTWVADAASTTNRVPLVDNCIRVEFQYARTNATGLTWSPTLPNQITPPVGVLVTMLVMDNKTANRIASIKSNSVLTASEISAATNTSSASTGTVERLLREGTTVIRRYVPLVNSAL